MRFIKQFFLTRLNIYPKFGNEWNVSKIGDYLLYCDIDLEVCEVENEVRKVIIIGNLFDYENYKFSNHDILKCVLGKKKPYNDFIRLFDKYSGNFLVFSFEKGENNIRIFTDNASLRELYYYYSSKLDVAVAASQPISIAKLLDLESDGNPEAVEFYNSSHFVKRRVFVGDVTNYAGVFRLKPNYFLNFQFGKVERYFPSKSLTPGDFEECAQKASKMISGYLLAANYRKRLAIPVSAGWESRVLLAASKEISQKTFYFVFKHSHYSEDHQDIKTPRRLFGKLGLKFNVLEYSTNIEEEEKAKISQLYSFPRFDNFGYILNVYGKEMSDMFILNGNTSEIARTQFDGIKIKDKYRVAFMEGYPFYKYAVRQYEKWLGESEEVFKKYNYRTADMLYWEENSCNWVSKSCSEVRCVSEYFQPFNSRELISTLMSVDIKHRWKQNPALYRRIIEILWPECLSEPINPSPRKQLIKFFQKIGLYGLYRENHLKFKMFLKKSVIRLKL